MQVIAAAMGAHIRHASGDDCSQLVHEVYDRAGYSYPYANSWDLYDGSDHFHRVWTPQPGDLVVWQGHVGIVVSPKEHLFFSKLTSSGQDIASYNDPYWRGRGHPRFFRYVKPEDASEGVVASRSRVRPALRAAAKTTPASRPLPKPASEVADAEPARSPSPSGFDAAPSEDTPVPAPAPSAAGAAVRVKGKEPRPEQVQKAILRTLAEAAPALGDKRAPALSQLLVVFDDLRVERVNLDDGAGWAEVRIHQVGSVNAGRAELNHRTQRAFWSLHQRDDGDWELLTPPDAIYLPRKAAVPVVAHQIAMLSDAPEQGAPDPAQKKALAKLLNLLMEP